MSKGYWMVRIDITDPAKYEAYQKLVDAPLRKFGGRFLVRGDKLDVVERTWRPSWLVIIEFPSMEALRAWLQLRFLSRTEGVA